MNKVLLVGEAFGAQEEKIGEPFVGPSGQLLRRALEGAGFKNYSFTNLCMFRPPNNRRPTKSEIDLELPRLMWELEDAKTVILLGRTVVSILTPEQRLGFDPIYYTMNENGQTFYNMYHPAYILRNLNKFPDYVNAFKLINSQLTTDNQ